MTATLLLNATFEPLHVISGRRAVILVLAEKAEILEASDDAYHSERQTISVPKVIRLLRWVKVPVRARLPISRRNVLARDNGHCAYRGQPRHSDDPRCAVTATTIDHVQPRSRGGRHKWENVVASCEPCNFFKNDRTLKEMGWRLEFKPWAPQGQLWIAIGMYDIEPSWTPYLAHLPAS